MVRVLSVLETERDLIRQEKASLLAKRKILTDEVARLEGTITSIVERQASETYTSVAELHERDIGDKALRRLEDQKDKVAHATQILDDEELAPVQERLNVAEQKYGSVELLLNRRREEWKQAQEKEEVRRLDDVGGLRWFRQREDNDNAESTDDETS